MYGIFWQEWFPLEHDYGHVEFDDEYYCEIDYFFWCEYKGIIPHCYREFYEGI